MIVAIYPLERKEIAILYLLAPRRQGQQKLDFLPDDFSQKN